MRETTARWTPSDPDYAARVRESFARQAVMRLIDARLTRVEPGEVEIQLPYRADLTQQDGYLHAGIVSTVADSAGGYAGYTLMPAASRVLSVEYRLHFLAPAEGERLIATGRVKRSGRTLTVCELEAVVVKGEARTVCAWGTQTLICLAGPPGLTAA
jgi:uncharacterized protein (TIGR00369 family)